MSRNPRMLFGKGTDGNIAWRASRSGVNVLTNTDPELFTFNSDWPRTGLIHETGQVSEAGWVYFAELPFVPHVSTFGMKDGKLIADRQTVIEWPSTGGANGPVTTWFPDNIQNDRFLFDIISSDADWPDSLVYIVWAVPIPGA